MSELKMENVPPNVSERVRAVLAEVASWTPQEAEVSTEARDASRDAVFAELVSDLLPAETLAPLRAGLEAVRAHRQQTKRSGDVMNDPMVMEIIAALDELSRKAEQGGNIPLAVRLAEISIQERTAQIEEMRKGLNR